MYKMINISYNYFSWSKSAMKGDRMLPQSCNAYTNLYLCKTWSDAHFRWPAGPGPLFTFCQCTSLTGHQYCSSLFMPLKVLCAKCSRSIFLYNWILRMWGMCCVSTADTCAPQPCENGGRCVLDPQAPAGYDCDCSGTLYTGTNCQTPSKWYTLIPVVLKNCDEPRGGNSATRGTLRKFFSFISSIYWTYTRDPGRSILQHYSLWSGQVSPKPRPHNMLLPCSQPLMDRKRRKMKPQSDHSAPITVMWPRLYLANTL